MQDLEYIDNYFKGALPKDEAGRFEKRIKSDASFAEAVTFYCMTMQVAKEELIPEKKKRFSELYRQYNTASPAPTSTDNHTLDGLGIDATKRSIVRRMLPYAAAAAVLILAVIGWWIWVKPIPPQQLAAHYTEQHFNQLDVTMSSREDSLQTGLRLYNDNKPVQALQQFESILLHSPADFTALKYAGIVSLQMADYDKALQYFRRLEQRPGQLYSNPGKFYYALTLMKRSKTGDPELAKTLLQQVVNDNLEGKETAQQWLRKW